MKRLWAFALMAALSAGICAQGPVAVKSPTPELVIGRDTFFDFGRPLLTHPANTCLLFPIYAASQPPASDACVKLVRSEPFQPDESPLPKYPDDAKAAHVEGDVSFHLEVGSGCATEEITIDDGPKLLREAVENAVKDWKFCGVPEGQEIRATIAFRLNCPAK